MKVGLTTTVDMEANRRSGQAVHKVTPSAGFHIHAGIPLATIVSKAGTHRQSDDAFLELRVAAIEPDGSVAAAMVL